MKTFQETIFRQRGSLTMRHGGGLLHAKQLRQTLSQRGKMSGATTLLIRQSCSGKQRENRTSKNRRALSSIIGLIDSSAAVKTCGSKCGQIIRNPRTRRGNQRGITWFTPSGQQAAPHDLIHSCKTRFFVVMTWDLKNILACQAPQNSCQGFRAHALDILYVQRGNCIGLLV